MKTLTVIPIDQTIIFDGEAFRVEFEPHEEFHALQWYGDHGYIEYDAGARVKPLTMDDHKEIVLPYARIWEDEKLRLEAENLQPSSNVK